MSDSSFPSGDARYRLGPEIGHGGLGRVVTAFDRSLQRDVAIKLVLTDLPPELRERFMREARLSGRLEHPNIVPVYDLGEVDGELFLAMKRVQGRDLGKLLRALAQGDEKTVASYSRARLLGMFQDICLAIAFAHSKGVIHRDLKPANVMIGDYGEVLVVDWGLAKELGSVVGEAAEAGDGRTVTALGATVVPGRGGDVAMTLEGDVLGTPAYMAPEQAEGRHADVDERSDVYALGAILYEILTFHPPVEGASLAEILSHAVSGIQVAPSQRFAADHRAGAAIPAELDAICMKALATRREDRYQEALDLHREIQLYLEGVKDLERRRRLADEAVAKARAAWERHGSLRAQAAAAADRVQAKVRETPKWSRDKQALWKVEDEARDLERAAVEAHAEAEAALTLALGHDSNHADARHLRAVIAWDRFAQAEDREDEAAMLLHRREVESFNDGDFDKLLKGDGTLSVRTRSWPCACLVKGRLVQPEELWHGDCHLFSGRILTRTDPADALPALEPPGPLTLRVHGKECATVDAPGAEVWLYRYEEIDRQLVPVTPSGVRPAAPPPAGVLDALFPPRSPYRPRGPGRFLGRTPLADVLIPAGSWLLIVARDGFLPARCPVHISRCASRSLDLTLWREAEIPPGLLPVAEGPFVYQGDGVDLHGAPRQLVVLPDFLIARQPVTCREYAAYLNDLAATDPRLAASHAPRDTVDAPSYWPGPPYAVPTAAWLAAASPELRARASRLDSSPIDWEEDWPAAGISWEDAMVYCDWKRRKEGYLFRLPLDAEWEKSGRGVDGRVFPWGKHFSSHRANIVDSHEHGMRPAAVEDFPDDESPFGARGLCGNSRDQCLEPSPTAGVGWRALRGGNWNSAPSLCRLPIRLSSRQFRPWHSGGVRVAVQVRLS